MYRLFFLILPGVVGPFPDGVDQPLTVAGFFDGQVEDTVVADFQKLCKVLRNQKVVASLDPCRR